MTAVLSDVPAALLRRLTLLVLCITLALPLSAQAQAPDAARLAEILRSDEIVAIMRSEGISYAMSLDDELLAGQGGAEWRRRVEALYDETRMSAVFTTQFVAVLAGQDTTVSAAAEFFGTDLGQRILSLEISARAALLDEGIDEAAREAAARLVAERGPRYTLLTEFIDANDLMETNVASALNASLAFYSAFVAAGGVGYDMPEQDIMADVWSSEAEIRGEVRDWLYAFLGMAYALLSAEEVATYIAYSRTPEGQALNRALLTGFDVMFNLLSAELGRAAGERLAAPDL